MTSPDSRGMLARGLDILSALGNAPDGMALSDVARAVELPISTTHRLLNTEVERGFASLDKATKRYTLGVHLFELANRVSSVRSISQIARPAMRSLGDETGEVNQLAILTEGRALFIERYDVDRSIGIRGTVGQLEPLYCTSTGKVLLSQLSEPELDTVLTTTDFAAWTDNTITEEGSLRRHLDLVRSQDYAVAEEEYDKHVRAIAVPVRTGDGAVAAALCITAPTFRVDQDQLVAWLPQLRDTAHAIGIQLPRATPNRNSPRAKPVPVAGP